MTQETPRKKHNRYYLILLRALIILALLILQIILIIFLHNLGGEIASTIFTLLSVLLVIFMVNRKGQAGFKMIWILFFLVAPAFGGMFYLFFQLQPSKRRIQQKLDEMEGQIRPLLQDDGATERILASRDQHMAALCHYLNHKGHYPVWSNTSVKYLPTGEEFYAELLTQLEKAEHYILMEFFILGEGKMLDGILDILRRKVEEGVEVRLMYDGLCALLRLPIGYQRELREMGIKAKVFAQVTPLLTAVQNYRDHRKIVVIDGNTAFTGGINLADEYINELLRFGHWKDSGVMIQGDAVRNLTMAYLEMWNVDESEPENFDLFKRAPSLPDNPQGYVVPFADSPFDEEYVAEHVYMDFIYSAEKYLHIMTPYLVIGDDMVEALTFAAKRGVDVELILPHIPDKRYAFQVAHTYYPELIEAGIKIYEYTPGFLHTKAFVSDDKKAVVGTINLDYRSIYLHFEDAVLFFNTPVVGDVEQDFQNVKSQSQQMTVEDYRKLSWFGRFLGRLFRLLAPLM
ncbi:MAG: cardiolipin synthase [Firmicutes bacterium]|nr:cardiolipin synthase [Bacillota bacterium]